jgi:hypothetical protein
MAKQQNLNNTIDSLKENLKNGFPHSGKPLFSGGGSGI